MAEKRKRNLYAPKWIFDANHILVPFAIETGGAWGQDAIKFLKYIARQARTHEEYELPLCYSHFYRRLTECVAVATQRAVAEQIIHYLRYQRQSADDVKQSDGSAGSLGGQPVTPAAQEKTIKWLLLVIHLNP